MKDPDLLWYDTVVRFSKQSRCKSRQVGCVLVDKFGHQFAQGWNSAPQGSNTGDCFRCKEKIESGKDLHLAICTHAEINAISHAARAGNSTDQATLYCTTLPCAECTKAIISAGIVEVVYSINYDSPLTRLLFENAGVKVRCFHE